MLDLQLLNKLNALPFEQLEKLLQQVPTVEPVVNVEPAVQSQEALSSFAAYLEESASRKKLIADAKAEIKKLIKNRNEVIAQVNQTHNPQIDALRENVRSLEARRVRFQKPQEN